MASRSTVPRQADAVQPRMRLPQRPFRISFFPIGNMDRFDAMRFLAMPVCARCLQPWKAQNENFIYYPLRPILQ
jgi:hypothetical protein